tara:strand:- start:2651 stop:3499 length:849 start_codon:yes stop_codon:yes gene_type:complete
MRNFFLGENREEQFARVDKEKALVKKILAGDSSNPKRVKITKEMMLQVVKQSGGSLDKVGESWQNDRSFILSAMRLASYGDNGPLKMSGVPEKFKSDPGVFLEACKNDVNDNTHINAKTQQLLRQYAEDSKPGELYGSWESYADSSNSTNRMGLGGKIAVMAILAANRVSIAVASVFAAVRSSSASKAQDDSIIVNKNPNSRAVSAEALSSSETQAQSASMGDPGTSKTTRKGQTRPISAQSEPSKPVSGLGQGGGRPGAPKKSSQQRGEAPSRPNARGPGR